MEAKTIGFHIFNCVVWQLASSLVHFFYYAIRNLHRCTYIHTYITPMLWAGGVEPAPSGSFYDKLGCWKENSNKQLTNASQSIL